MEILDEDDGRNVSGDPSKVADDVVDTALLSSADRSRSLADRWLTLKLEGCEKAKVALATQT
jgi:hypothetical protein